jgi:glycosyltransferase involved in cell wall biosynthesis
MTPLRVLLVVLAPLDSTLGASQMALNLAGALRAAGVDATLWSPYPKKAVVPWWRELSWMRRSLREFVAKNGPFDVIDALPAALSGDLGRNAVLVARSVQPDLRYLWISMRARGPRRSYALARQAVEAAFGVYVATLIVSGWQLADHILCLGSLERDWMHRRFPWWRSKTTMYVNAIAGAERPVLAEVRRSRRAFPGGPTRYLWLGRWTAHKGTRALVDFLERKASAGSADTVTIAGCGETVEHDIGPAVMTAANVTIVPRYGRDELPALLREHDAGLFTSSVEGWGLTIQEMLESGMPVYATEAGAVPDLRGSFAALLRPFPPPMERESDARAPAELDPAYLDRFNWDAIANDYVVLASRLSRGA